MEGNPSSLLWIDFHFNSSYKGTNQSGKGEIDGGYGQKWKESLVCAASYDVAGLGQILDCNVANDGCQLHHANDLTFVEWKDVGDGLRHDDTAKNGDLSKSKGCGSLPLPLVNGIDPRL